MLRHDPARQPGYSQSTFVVQLDLELRRRPGGVLCSQVLSVVPIKVISAINGRIMFLHFISPPKTQH